jgi:hypothetical protein
LWFFFDHDTQDDVDGDEEVVLSFLSVFLLLARHGGRCVANLLFWLVAFELPPFEVDVRFLWLVLLERFMVFGSAGGKEKFVFLRLKGYEFM